MTKLLTIAIPTYNRADRLDQQLAWVTKAIQGFEADCEIFVSDNCSTDSTQAVIEKWQSALTNVAFQFNRNRENVGLIGNIACCLKAAKSQYVWTIGDDDPIQERALSYVVHTIKQHGDLSLLFLNYSGRHQETNQPIHPPTIEGNRWFDIHGAAEADGKAVFEYCLHKSLGSVMFLTATVYRTELAQQALQAWSSSLDNWIAQTYWTGYCAARGRVIVTEDLYLECIVGVSYWQKDPQHALMMQYKHAPEVYSKLWQTGYSNRFYRRMMLHAFHEAKLKVFLGALRRWPLLTLKTVVPFLVLVGISAIDLAILRLTSRPDHPSYA